MEPVTSVSPSRVQTPRTGERWSAADEGLLLSLYRSDRSWTRVSDATGRTVEACKGRYYKLTGPKRRKLGRPQSW